jgi:hypothetical protein
VEKTKQTIFTAKNGDVWLNKKDFVRYLLNNRKIRVASKRARFVTVEIT